MVISINVNNKVTNNVLSIIGCEIDDTCFHVMCVFL